MSTVRDNLRLSAIADGKKTSADNSENKQSINERSKSRLPKGQQIKKIYTFKIGSYNPEDGRRSSRASLEQEGFTQQVGRPLETMVDCLVRDHPSSLLTLVPSRSSNKRGKRAPAKNFALSEQFKLIGKTCSQGRCKNGKLKLPKLPRTLRWPTKRYFAEHKKTGVHIIQFLRNEWAELIEAGYGELRWLRLVDRKAARAVANYERANRKSGARKRLPRDIYFLTESEVTDRKLGCGFDVIKFDPRLLGTMAQRLRRGGAIVSP